MSAESDYLNKWLTDAHAFGMTFTSSQRPRQRAGPHVPWAPGLAGFGWSNFGSRKRGPDGKAIALVFSAIAWFSDRVVNPGVTPPAWQQFSAAASDGQLMTFSPNGEHVHLHAVLLRWGNATWESDSFAFDSPSEQLLFRVPGAGAGAPPALMMTSFGPGAGFL